MERYEVDARPSIQRQPGLSATKNRKLFDIASELVGQTRRLAG